MEHITRLSVDDRERQQISSHVDWDRVKVISWDVDGTLYDMRLMVRALRGLALRHLLTGRWYHLWRGGRALRRHLQFVKRVRGYGGDLTSLSSQSPWHHPDHEVWLKTYLLPAVERAGLRMGMRACISSISSIGIRQVIVSDFRAKDKLDIFKLTAHFSELFAGEDIGKIKPSPHLFHHVCRALSIEPQELLHIGDKDKCDGVAARRAGCQVIISTSASWDQLYGSLSTSLSTSRLNSEFTDDTLDL